MRYFTRLRTYDVISVGSKVLATLPDDNKTRIMQVVSLSIIKDTICYVLRCQIKTGINRNHYYIKVKSENIIELIKQSTFNNRCDYAIGDSVKYTHPESKIRRKGTIVGIIQQTKYQHAIVRDSETGAECQVQISARKIRRIAKK